MSRAVLTVLEAGPLTTVQDRGRTGWAHVGVPRAGALDDRAAALALRLLAEDPDAALLEVTLGRFRVQVEGGRWAVVTGAPGPVAVAGRPVAHAEPVWVPDGAELSVGEPTTGVRRYLAVAGGIEVPPQLGSRSTDTLAWVGPDRVVDGAVLPVGAPGGRPLPHDTPRPPRGGPLRVHPGPRADWFAGDVLTRLCASPYTVRGDSNRIGLRLDGPPLERARDAELASEGMVLGAVQVPPEGTPVVFLADHPVTGGYPVVAVVDPDDLWQCAQLRPGDQVRFARVGQVGWVNRAPGAATR